MHSNRNANIHEKSLNYIFTLNLEDVLEKLKVLQVRLSEPGVSDGKQSCLHPEVYPINQHVVSPVSIQLMPCIYGFSIQIIKTLVLAFSEIWVSHPFTLLNQLKDVELTEYWSTGITSPCRAKAAPVPSQGETIHQGAQISRYTLPSHSVCLSVCLKYPMSCSITSSLLLTVLVCSDVFACVQSPAFYMFLEQKYVCKLVPVLKVLKVKVL